MKRIATSIAGVGFTACALLSLGAGTASAKLVADTSKFTHTATLEEGKLSVTVSNKTTQRATCGFRFFDAKYLKTLQEGAAAHNGWRNGTVSMTDYVLSTVKLQVELQVQQDKPMKTLEKKNIAAGQDAKVTWDTRRTATSYAVEATCLSGNNDNGTIAMEAFKVTGTGADKDTAQDSAGGSLEGLDMGSLAP